MYMERILKTIKKAFSPGSFYGIKDEDFYKPSSYDLDEEYKKYREMLQMGKKDRALFFRIGRINHYRGEIEEALKFYNKALEIEPLYGEVHYNMGNIYFQRGELEKSKDHFLKAIKVNTEDIYSLNALARVYLSLKEFGKTLKYHMLALDINPKDLYALRGMGNVYLLQQNSGEALNYYYRALDINPFDGITLYNMGLIYLLSGKFENGEKHYRENLQRYDFSGFYFGLGLCFYKRGKKIEAYDYYKKGLEREDTGEQDFLFNIKLDEAEWNILASEDHFCKAHACNTLNNVNQAMEELKTAIEINYTFPEAHNFLGKLYFEKGRLSDALKHYEISLGLRNEISVEKDVCELKLTLNPKDIKSLVKLQNIYWLNENFAKEIEILEKIIRFSPEALYFYKLGCTCLFSGDKKRAEDAFNQLFDMEEEDLSYTGMARLCSAKSDYESALKYIKKALSIRKESEYYIEQGHIYENIDEPEKAMNSYFEAFRVSPYSAMAHRYYVDSLLTIKDEKGAFKIISKLKNLPGYNLLLSLLYIRLGEYDKAMKTLLHLNLNSEKEGIFHLYLGICYQEKGYFEKALEEFENCVSYEEFRGEACGLMALIYKELGDRDKLIEMVRETGYFIRFTGPVLRCRLCLLMWQENLFETLEEFLPRAIWSINFHHNFSSPPEKDTAIAKLNDIREKIIKEKIKYKKEVEREKTAVSTLKEEGLKKLPTDKDMVSRRDYRENIPAFEPVSLEAGRGLLPLIDPNRGGKLFERINSLKRTLELEPGIPVSHICLRENISLKNNEYIIKIRDIEVASGEIMLNRFLAINPDGRKCPESIKGYPCFSPLHGTFGVWITQEERNKAEEAGCMIFEPLHVISGHLKEIIRLHAFRLIDRQTVANLLEKARKTHAVTVEDLYPVHLTLGEIQKVLQNLLREKVSVRDIITILETLGDCAPFTRDTILLTEYVRQALSRTICKELQSEEGKITVITLEPAMENIITGAVERKDFSSFPVLSPEKKEIILNSLEKEIEVLKELGMKASLLCTASTRPWLRRIIEKKFPDIRVISFNEIPSDVEIHSVGVVKISDKKPDEGKDIFSYIELMLQDCNPSVRCEAIKSLSYTSRKEEREKILSYIEKGMNDPCREVKQETARTINELCRKKF